MSHRTIVTAAAVLLLAVAAAGYLHLRDRTFVVTVSEAELQERVEALPPLTRTYLGIFRVTLDQPRVSLVEGADRVRAGSEVALEVGLGTRALAFRGSVDGSGGIRYEPETGALHLTDLRVERLDLPGLPAEHEPRARDAVSRALGAYFARHPVHTLRPTDLPRAAARRLLRDVAVRDRHLRLTFGL